MIDLQYFVRDIDKCSDTERKALIVALIAYADAIREHDIEVYNEIYDWYFCDLRYHN